MANQYGNENGRQPKVKGWRRRGAKRETIKYIRQSSAEPFLFGFLSLLLVGFCNSFYFFFFVSGYRLYKYSHTLGCLYPAPTQIHVNLHMYFPSTHTPRHRPEKQTANSLDDWRLARATGALARARVRMNPSAGSSSTGQGPYMQPLPIQSNTLR